MTVVDRYSPPSPGLASRSARHFSAGAIYRAQAHAHEKRGKVQLDQVTARSVQARVEAAAGTPHTVNVAAPIHRPGVLRCGCTCPVAGGGEPCEHVYAVLLTLDRQAIELGAVGKAFTLDVGPPWIGRAHV